MDPVQCWVLDCNSKPVQWQPLEVSSESGPISLQSSSTQSFHLARASHFEHWYSWPVRSSKVPDRDPHYMYFVVLHPNDTFAKGARVPWDVWDRVQHLKHLNQPFRLSSPWLSLRTTAESQDEDRTRLALRNRAGCFWTSVWISWRKCNFADFLGAVGSHIYSSFSSFLSIQHIMTYNDPFSEPFWWSRKPGSTSPGRQ